ncbi:MAG: DUF2807 domain-containing protein [Bacteroidales bacterium]|nr:DUF2807 domain-containing protein [Bacteroidales bacterium]
MRNIVIASIILCIAFCSCQKINGNGELRTDTISITEKFNEVRNDTKFDVEVLFANENKVVITGESNIIDYLSVYVKKGELVIKKEKNKYKLRNTQPVTITVYMKRNDYLYYDNYGAGDMTIESPLSKKIKFDNTGSGDIYAFDVEHEAVEISNSGSGDVVISGVTGEVKITCSGSGDVDCYNLIAQYVEIHSSGTGRVEAYATDAFDIWQSGSGEVYPYGTDRIRFHYEEYDDD